ncbi:MAG: hypothetical protein IMZ74_19735 [Actinobacteria bacterium]|nr:hypothetical protein [Actinomycetota bacterium]
MSTSTAKRDLKELQEKGLVEHVGPPKTGKWRLVTGPHGVRQDARAEHDD